MTKYTAEFENGRVLKRSTRDRTYTHAWLIEYVTTEKANWSGAGKAGKVSGFSGNQHLAEKALASARSAVATYAVENFAGIVPTVEVK